MMDDQRMMDAVLDAVNKLDRVFAQTLIDPNDTFDHLCRNDSLRVVYKVPINRTVFVQGLLLRSCCDRYNIG